MQEDGIAVVHGEKNSSDGILEVDANFPKALIHLSHQGHSKRPPKLDCADVVSDRLSFGVPEAFQPFANRLPPCR